jgi:hypothetical protein
VCSPWGSYISAFHGRSLNPPLLRARSAESQHLQAVPRFFWLIVQQSCDSYESKTCETFSYIFTLFLQLGFSKKSRINSGKFPGYFFHFPSIKSTAVNSDNTCNTPKNVLGKNVNDKYFSIILSFHTWFDCLKLHVTRIPNFSLRYLLQITPWKCENTIQIYSRSHDLWHQKGLCDVG